MRGGARDADVLGQARRRVGRIQDEERRAALHRPHQRAHQRGAAMAGDRHHVADAHAGIRQRAECPEFQALGSTEGDQFHSWRLRKWLIYGKLSYVLWKNLFSRLDQRRDPWRHSP